mmetsp:Transcript_9638/g.30901  ORF Transcript_9638/g.30901 Transcript_9638/m.30901 type:complete len:435 (+) Transcript_9638:58-1362(+)
MVARAVLLSLGLASAATGESKGRVPTLFVDGARATFVDVADGAKATFSEVAETMGRRAAMVREASARSGPVVREATTAAREAADATWSRLSKSAGEEAAPAAAAPAKAPSEEEAPRRAASSSVEFPEPRFKSKRDAAEVEGVTPPSRQEVSHAIEDLTSPAYVAPVDVAANKVLPQPKKPVKVEAPKKVEAVKKVEPVKKVEVVAKVVESNEVDLSSAAAAAAAKKVEQPERKPVVANDLVEKERYGALFSAAEVFAVATSPKGRRVARRTAGLAAALGAVQTLRAPNLELLAASLVVSTSSPLVDVKEQLSGPDPTFKTAWRLVAKPMQVIALARLHSGRMTFLSRLAFCLQLALCDAWRRDLDNVKLAFAYAGTLAASALLFASTELGAGLFLVPSLAAALAAAQHNADLHYHEPTPLPVQRPRGFLASIFA